MTNTMKWWIEREIANGQEEQEWQEIEVCLEYSWLPGCPEQGPTYACGGQPAEPAEVSDVIAYDCDGKKIDLTDDELESATQYVFERHDS